MKVFFFFIIFLSAGSLYSQDEKWFQLDPGDKEARYYYDMENTFFDRIRNHVTVPFKTVYLSDVLLDGKLLSYKIEKIRIYCARETFSLLETKYFFADGTQDRKVNNIYSGKHKETLIKSFSNEEMLYVMLCR